MRKWNGETEATQPLAYGFLKSAINNNSLIYTAIPQKGLAWKGPKPPKYPSNLSCQNSRKSYTKRTQFFLSEGRANSVSAQEEAGNQGFSKGTLKKLNTEPFISEGIDGFSPQPSHSSEALQGEKINDNPKYIMTFWRPEGSTLMV